MQYTTDQEWVGGTKTETVATDAKNASPISAVSFNLNSTQYVSHLDVLADRFLIDLYSSTSST
jgi:hypothetical protein